MTETVHVTSEAPGQEKQGAVTHGAAGSAKDDITADPRARRDAIDGRFPSSGDDAR